jgi:hypothetical protein
MSRAEHDDSEPSSDLEAIDLSNDQTISTPVHHVWSCVSAAWPASLDRVRDVLPTHLSPVRIGPQTSVVGLVSVRYEEISDHGPYNAAGVMIPVSSNDSWLRKSISPLALFGVGPGLEVFAYRFPASDETSYELGDEICGLHTGTADIEIEDLGRTHRTTIQIDDEDALTLNVECARNAQWWRSLNGYIHSRSEDGVPKARLETHGSYGIIPFSGQASFALGDHPWADDIRALDLGERPLGRVYASEIIGQLYPGEPI